MKRKKREVHYGGAKILTHVRRSREDSGDLEEEGLGGLGTTKKTSKTHGSVLRHAMTKNDEKEVLLKKKREDSDGQAEEVHCVGGVSQWKKAGQNRVLGLVVHGDEGVAVGVELDVACALAPSMPWQCTHWMEDMIPPRWACKAEDRTRTNRGLGH
jgi:hypothetical protein